MKPKITFIIGTMSVAAWVTAGAALAQSSGTNKQTIHPDVSGSRGGIAIGTNRRIGSAPTRR